MIKRTTKPKTTGSRAGLPKATAIKAEPATIEPVKPAAVNLERGPQINRPSLSAEAPKTRLEIVKPEAQTVCVAGSFNDWNPARTPLTRLTDGKWVGELTGVSGRHEYLFVVDGQWLPDPNAKESVQNP